MSVVNIQGMSKKLGDKHVLKHINLQVNKGEVLGLVGANGAGKSTLLKTMVGLLKPDFGICDVFLEPSWEMSDKSKQQLGFVPQSLDFFHNLKVRHLIESTSAFYPTWNDEKLYALLLEWQISTEARIMKLSEGQRQRLFVSLALAHSPALLVLDEPVASLDPSARRAFINQLIEINSDAETSIIFSTHITSDIERVAADVAFLKDGKIAFRGAVDELKEQVVRLHIQASQDLPQHLNIPHALSSMVSGNKAKLTVKGFEPANIKAWESQYDAKINVEHLSLEDIFLELNR
jgi:ABC-2 type transport system ATP-binding protein